LRVAPIACVFAVLAGGCVVGPAKTLIRTQAEHTVKFHALPVAQEAAKDELQTFKDGDWTDLLARITALETSNKAMQKDIDRMEGALKIIGLLVIGGGSGAGIVGAAMQRKGSGKAAVA